MACDLLTVDTVLLQRLYVLFFIDLDTRLVHLAGVTAKPFGSWVAQQARNVCYGLPERCPAVKFLVRDRDAKFTSSFDAVFTADGARVIKTPVRAPRANAVAERFVGTLRRECLDRLLVFGRLHLERVLADYVEHYNQHRPHRSLGQRSPSTAAQAPVPLAGADPGRLRRQEVLGGLIHEYRLVA